MRLTVEGVRASKASKRLVMVTAYDCPSASLAERAGVDLLLVGDSAGMVVHGYDTTIPVTLDMMVQHCAAVTRGAPETLIVADLPFLTYTSEADAIVAARRIMQEGGAQAVKLEGGQAVIDVVRHLTSFGVPVMGHLGFTPQSQHQLGVRVQAKESASAGQLLEDAVALEMAGAFAIVLELIPAALANHVTDRLSIPTIGIGAGAACDGQVQVWHDLLGLSLQKPPRHAKRYADIANLMIEALRSYGEEVRAGLFPAREHSSSAAIDPTVFEDQPKP